MERQMRFTASARYTSISPYKLRPLVDVVRGKSALFALSWLSVNKNRRVVPLLKLIESAVANARHARQDMAPDVLKITRIYVDQGPIRRYFKPGAQGRAMPQRRRLSHINVVLEANNLQQQGA